MERVPGFINDSYLLVEIDELDQLLLQDLLSADAGFDEDVLQQVQHVGPQLKVLDQTSGRVGEGKRELDLYSFISALGSVPPA